ncbi:hypothetical protein BT69DRAFT_325593 [Atractiella rhizophila]|nr:hypothetical protein BT69DRAFT_325593 [Atractiella rhizophila]
MTIVIYRLLTDFPSPIASLSLLPSFDSRLLTLTLCLVAICVAALANVVIQYPPYSYPSSFESERKNYSCFRFGNKSNQIGIVSRCWFVLRLFVTHLDATHHRMVVWFFDDSDGFSSADFLLKYLSTCSPPSINPCFQLFQFQS